MLGLIPQVNAKVNEIPEVWLSGCLIAIALALVFIALFVEQKEIKALAVAYILIP